MSNVGLHSVLLDTITYFTTMVGIVRAGYAVFPISPRNSPEAVADLLSKTAATHILVGAEQSLQDLTASALQVMAANCAAPLPHYSPMPSFEDIYVDDSDHDFKPLPPFKPDWCDPAIIMHSSGMRRPQYFMPASLMSRLLSGSTKFPKPILWTHYRIFLLALTPCTPLHLV